MGLTELFVSLDSLLIGDTQAVAVTTSQAEHIERKMIFIEDNSLN